MRLEKLFLAPLMFLFFLTAAHAADWTVAKAFGEVWVQTSGVQKTALVRGTRLDKRTTIVTGPNGRAVLVRNKESMTIGPDAEVTVPGPSLFGRTTIQQSSGFVTYDVEKRNVRHFSVRTPMLSAVVKGTRFEVSVRDTAASVFVQQGTVRVSSHSTGERTDITKGHRASVVRGSGRGLVVDGPDPTDPRVLKRMKKAGKVAGANPGSKAQSTLSFTGQSISNKALSNLAKDSVRAVESGVSAVGGFSGMAGDDDDDDADGGGKKSGKDGGLGETLGELTK